MTGRTAGWTMRAALVALAGACALGAGGCRTERGTFGEDAQPRSGRGTGGAGDAGIGAHGPDEAQEEAKGAPIHR